MLYKFFIFYFFYRRIDVKLFNLELRNTIAIVVRRMERRKHNKFKK